MKTSLQIAICIWLAAGVGGRVVGDELSSENHPLLRRILAEHPDADADQDKILSRAEYRRFSRRPGARRQDDGRPTGPLSTLLDNGEMVVSDFEENNLGQMREWGWEFEGDAFHRELSVGTRIMQRRAGSVQGRYLLTSLVVSDLLEGRILSPEFRIELDYIEMVMSGGDHPHRVCVNLIVDDNVVRTATGDNDDLLSPVAFDVKRFVGRKARIEIVDKHRGLWGHINVDRIYQTIRPRAEIVISESPQDFGRTFGGVLTRDGKRRHGPSAIQGGQLTIVGETIALGSLLLAVCENDPATPADSNVLRLINGESWNVRITGMAEKGVTISSSRFGQRTVPVSQVASLAFVSGPNRHGEPGTLYRTKGEPIPGTLVWIRDKDIAIDCPLGVIPIPRPNVQRFVVAAVDRKKARADDEIGLTDGSLFRGRLSLEDDKVTLAHPTLGPLRFDWKEVRYLQRTPAGVDWLDKLESSDLKQVGPVLPPPAPSVISDSTHKQCLRAVRMLPHTVIRYRLPVGNGVRRLFRARVNPVAGCRSDVMVRILAGDQPVWEQRVDATNAPVAVTADLGIAAEMTIEVDFGKQLAFPSGVNWLDGCVLTVEK